MNTIHTEVLRVAAPSAESFYLEAINQRLIGAQIPERLARSPDPLAVILNEGKV